MYGQQISMARSIPSKYSAFSLSELTSTPTFDGVRSYADNIKSHLSKKRGLLLVGANGIGKTGALASIHNLLATVRPMWGVKERMWCRARDIAKTYEYGHFDETFDEPVDELYNSCAWLVIDELGREADVKNFEHRMHSLLSSRRDNMKITSFTSNLSLSQIRNIYGEGFYSILHETSAFIIECDGPDRRML